MKSVLEIGTPGWFFVRCPLCNDPMIRIERLVNEMYSSPGIGETVECVGCGVKFVVSKVVFHLEVT